MEPYQVDVVTAAVFCRLEQILHIAETRLARQIISDIGEAHWRDRIHDNLSLVHRVTTAHLDVRSCPDANAAPDPPASNSLTKTFGEYHEQSYPNGTVLSNARCRGASMKDLLQSATRQLQALVRRLRGQPSPTHRSQDK